jgi:hypothetical protein
MRAWAQWNCLTPKSNAEAQRLAREALALDPIARAHS